MSFLVFDIETAGLPFDNFDEGQQEYLLRGAGSDEERQQRIDWMSLNPLTARVVAIGIVTAHSLEDDGKGCVLYNEGDESNVVDRTLEDGSTWRSMSETELLRQWWGSIEKRGRDGEPWHLVTFNGRGFDCPFLMLRSMALGIKPTRNLMDGTRWNYKHHTDLQDRLAFFGSERAGAMRRFNLDFYCKSFGVPTPKEGGITGADVSNFYNAGRHNEIAEYALRDVWATWDLYRTWWNSLGELEERDRRNAWR